MSSCCLNCFTDKAIIELIQREGVFGFCSFCHSDDILCVEPKRISNILELPLICLFPNENGKQLHELYQSDLMLISNRVECAQTLLNEIMDDEYLGRCYSLKESITDYQNAWDDFKDQLIKINRFFPRSSLYSRIFTSDLLIEDQSTVESGVFLNTIEALSKTRHRNHVFYRARISEEELLSKDMGAPPPDKAAAGRANPIGIPYLYLAEEFNTCCREVRPSNGATLYVSEVLVCRELKLVDLTSPKLKISLLKFVEDELELVLKFLNLLQQFADELSKPVLPEKSHLEYIPTQFLCEYIRTIGPYDGIVFNSSYGNGKNVVLFSGSDLEIQTPTPHKVTSIDVTTCEVF